MTNTHEFTAGKLADQWGRRIAARLDQACNEVPHDISERLRIARSLALGRHRASQAVVQTQTASATAVHTMGGAAALQMGGGDHFNIWDRLAAWLPLLALLVGLLVINVVQDDFRARELAEVDAELLTDELPPGAWTDPGFTEFLRSQHQE